MKVRKMRTRRYTKGRVRSMTTKRLARTLKRRAINKTEVKYFTWVDDSVILPYQYPSSPTYNLYGPQFVLSNLLAGITEGTGRGQRVGGKIYVKFIQFHLWITSCPSSSTYNVDQFLVRTIVSNTGDTRIISGTTVPGYFSSPEKANANGFINRSYIHVYHDKCHRITGGTTPNTALIPNNFAGAFRRVSFTVPIGRVVDYINDGTSVKDNRDYICLMCLTAGPGMSPVTNGFQVGCMDITARVYYTDV